MHIALQVTESTMVPRKSFILAVLVVLPVVVGCSDDPAPTPFGPGSGDSASTSASSSNTPPATKPTKDAGAKDVEIDRDPGYRDPNKVDAGCFAPNQVCSGVCVDVGNDADNCGACGKQCTGPGAHCTASTCGCTGPLFDYCADQGGCMDVSSDVNNCGSCGNVCDPNNFNACVDGVCVQN